MSVRRQHPPSRSPLEMCWLLAAFSVRQRRPVMINVSKTERRRGQSHSCRCPGLKAEPNPVLWVREVALEVPGTVGARLPALNLVARIFTYIVIFNVKNNNNEIFLDYPNE